MNEPLLVLRDVQKHFSGLAVLRGISAEVPSGSITAFVGPNGAGKTTLFHTITGDLHLDAGTVLFRGRAIGNKSPWRIARLGLGKLFQDVRVFDGLTVLENILLALHDHTHTSIAASLLQAPTHWRSNSNERKTAEEWLEAAGLEPPYDRPAGSLSFGNKKLLAIARLMAGRFDLLLLDEPASGLDQDTIQKLADLLRILVTERNVTVALIEHNFSFVAELADRVYVLRAGRVQDFGATAEVLARDANREILIGL